MNARLTPATNLKIGTFILITDFVIQKGISKNLQPIRIQLFNTETIFYLTIQNNTPISN